MMFFNKFYSAILLISFFCAATLANDDLKANATFNVTVFYPEVRKPYNALFESIISGIKQQPLVNLQTRSINKSMSETSILSSLHQENPDAVIMLGSNLKSLQDKINPSIKAIYGASFFSTNDLDKGMSGISMDPDPTLLFKELKKIHPKIKKIHVVFDLKANGWLIQRAQERTSNSGIEVIPYEAKDVHQAALIYKKIARNSNHTEEALWLLHHDPTLDTKSLLPRVLADAWKYKQVVISSNPSHVRRGALISLLPDNQQIGKDLALEAVNILNGQKVNISPMKSSLVVANIRTAKHLSGLITLKNKSSFALTYPRKTAND